MIPKTLRCLFLIATTLGVLLFAGAVQAQQSADERILSFHSDITVHEDATMTVRETIKVCAGGVQIRHGIYRDFPTRYKDHLGRRYVVGFEVVEVLKNGQPEPYHLKNRRNGKRLYMGQESVFLRPGIYTYTLTYKTNRQIGFFQGHDELYWNVTGNGWAFPIDKASATVKLPAGASESVFQLDGFTGPFGSRAKNFVASTDDAGNINFTTTRPLAPGWGLTIVVSWPKGFVKEPTGQEKFGYFVRDNRGLMVGLLGLATLFTYYMITWVKVGRDPEKGMIIPLYEPPEGFSPAALRYIEKMGYDHKTFTAAIINMAVKGVVSIEEEDGIYTIIKNDADQGVLAPEEKRIFDELFSSREKIVLRQSNHGPIGRAVEGLKDCLGRNFKKIYFHTNRHYFIPGTILSFAFIIASVIAHSARGETAFLSIWLCGWSVGVIALLYAVRKSWRAAVSGGVKKASAVGSAVLLTLFVVPFVAAEVVVLGFLAHETSIAMMAVLFAIVALNWLFYHLLKAPTLKGREVLDKTEGFRMYMSAAEQERLNVLHPVDRTPELFERYLPYALALDVEQDWAEQFSDVLAAAGEGGTRYSPVWYSGPGWRSMGARGFTSSLGSSLSGAISSSSTAPGSSSGGGGGGFSGGGGGGGGGGGW